MGGVNLTTSISVFSPFMPKPTPCGSIAFRRAAFGVQSPKGSPLSLSKWRTEKGKTQCPFDTVTPLKKGVRERQQINN